MAIGSGLAAQLGFVAESTVGTAVTVSKFAKILTAGGNGLNKVVVVDEGLGAGQQVVTHDRRTVVARDAAREINLGVVSKGLGVLFKQMLGSTSGPTQIGVTTAYRQIHTPGDTAGKSLTVQLGMPETSGTVRAYTYRGAKVTDWTMECKRNDLLRLSLTLDAWDEDTGTGLAAASYLTGIDQFHFKQLSVKIGGTASISSGLVSVAAGATFKGVGGVSLKGQLPMADDRFNAGGSGVKSEQIENGFRMYTGDLDTEFADRTQLYDVYSADTATALQFTWTTSTDAGSSNFVSLDIIYPFVKFDSASPSIGGPDLLDGKSSFTAYADPAGTLPAMQLAVVSTETTL